MKLMIPAAVCAAISLAATSCEKKAEEAKKEASAAAGEAKAAAGEAKAAVGEAKAAAGEAKVSGEKAAIEAYGTAALAVKAWGDEQQKANKNNPAAALTMLSTAVEKFKAIKTDGLPADLKEAHEGVVAAVGKASAALTAIGIPAGDKPEDFAAFMGKMMTPDMMATMEGMSTASAKLGEVGEKYGLKGLNFDDKGGGPPPSDDAPPADAPPADAPPAGN
jgi:hypothetical protein